MGLITYGEYSKSVELNFEVKKHKLDLAFFDIFNFYY